MIINKPMSFLLAHIFVAFSERFSFKWIKCKLFVWLKHLFSASHSIFMWNTEKSFRFRYCFSVSRMCQIWFCSVQCPVSSYDPAKFRFSISHIQQQMYEMRFNCPMQCGQISKTRALFRVNTKYTYKIHSPTRKMIILYNVEQLQWCAFNSLCYNLCIIRSSNTKC